MLTVWALGSALLLAQADVVESTEDQATAQEVEPTQLDETLSNVTATEREASTQVTATELSGTRLSLSPQEPGQVYRWTIFDGSELVGRILESSESVLRIRLIDGSERVIYRQDIILQTAEERARVIRGQVWFDNPNRTRHLWAPSAIPLKKGEGYASAKLFTFLSTAWGWTDNVAVLGGTFWPGLLVGGDGFNLIGAIKYSDQITDNVYGALGVEVITFPAFAHIATPFVGLTLGNADRQITVNAGYLAAYETEGRDNIGEAMFSVTGQYRFLPGHALVMENLFFPGTSVDTSDSEDDRTEDGMAQVEPDTNDDDVNLGWGMVSLHALCYRQILEDSAWDYGLVLIMNADGQPLGMMPWVDYTWYLGTDPAEEG